MTTATRVLSRRNRLVHCSSAHWPCFSSSANIESTLRRACFTFHFRSNKSSVMIEMKVSFDLLLGVCTALFCLKYFTGSSEEPLRFLPFVFSLSLSLSLQKRKIMFVVVTRSRLLPVLCHPFSILRCSKSSSTRSSDSNSQLIKSLTLRGDYAKAFHLFDHLLRQKKVTVVSLLTILETCTRAEHLERGRQMERLINQSIEWKENIRLQTSLINMFMKCRQIDQGNRSIEIQSPDLSADF